jgi:hypothetical protein
MSQLQQEREFFKINQAQWPKAHSGKFVLIKGDQFPGFFDNAENAVAEGMRRFGSESFLVRGVDEKEETLRIPTLMFGLLNANSGFPI